MNMPHWLRTFLLTLAALALIASTAACADDDATSAPLKAFTSPVDGKTYCAWVENPHECPGPPGPPAAPFAMPQDEPHRDSGMSGTDFLLLMALFNYHTTYAPYYGGAGYYNHYVAPAWSRYPGTYYSGPGRTTIRTTNINVYTNKSTSFDKRYATQEKANAPKAEYKTANGKIYKGTQVPTKAFSGGNVRVDRYSPSKSGKSGSSYGRSSSGKSGYGSSSGGRSSYGGSSSSRGGK